MPTLEDKVDALSAAFHELHPVVEQHTTNQLALDARGQFLQMESARLRVEVDRLKEDLNGVRAKEKEDLDVVHDKLREIENTQRLRMAGETGKLVTMIEFLKDAPTWLRWVVGIATAGAAAAAALREFIPHLPHIQ